MQIFPSFQEQACQPVQIVAGVILDLQATALSLLHNAHPGMEVVAQLRGQGLAMGRGEGFLLG